MTKPAFRFSIALSVSLGILFAGALGQQSAAKYCGKCKKEVPAATKVGDKCPHCGAFFLAYIPPVPSADEILKAAREARSQPAGQPAQNSARPAANPGLVVKESRGVPPVIREITVARATNLIQESRGSVVVFHLYASWCPPCRKEFPDLNQLVQLYQGRDLKLLALSVDEDRSKLEKFLAGQQRLHVEPLRLLDPDEVQAALKRAGMRYQNAVPYTAIFDRSGKLSQQWSGAVKLTTYQSVIDPLLDEKPTKAAPAVAKARPAPEAPVAKDEPARPAPASKKKKPPAPVAPAPIPDAKPDEPADDPGPAAPSWLPYAVGGGVGAVVLMVGLLVPLLGRRRMEME